VKILLVNHYAGSPQMGMEFRPYYMAKIWQDMGHEVRIVASSFSHLRSKQPDICESGSATIEGIHYHFIKTSVYHGNGLMRIINILTFVAKLRFSMNDIIKDFRADIVIASSTYPFEIYVCNRIARKLKARLIFEVHDLWPLSPQLIGGYSKWNPLILTIQKAENDAYRYCDKVVSLLPGTLKHMVEHGLKPEKWNYIPNGYYIDDKAIETTLPETHQNVINLLKDKGAILVGYAGSIGLANDLHNLVLCQKQINDNNIHFIITGNGPEKEKLIESIEPENKNNFHFLEAVPKNTVPLLLKGMDILIISWSKSPLYKYGVSANKLFDYMMASKPIVQAINACNDPVTEANCGISVEPENPGLLAGAVRTIAGMSKSEREMLGMNGRQYVVSHHNYRMLAEQFIKVLGSS
jgi:glycosyltransferase involved in cell wall biosynthesis